MAEIFAVNIYEDVTDRQYQRLFNSAGASRSARAQRYRFKADERRCIYAGALLRHVLSGMGVFDYSLRYNEYGKPFLSSSGVPYFNVSHSGEWVICGISSKAIGVDVEQKGKPGPDIAKAFFHPVECEAVEQAASVGDAIETFYSIWTLKESFIKYLGTGLATPLDSFCFELGGGAITLRAPVAALPNCVLYDIDENHKAAVCTDDASVGEIQLVSLHAICKRLAG